LSREAGFFYYRLNKLDPIYDDCPAICRAPHADRANGCPDCEYTNALTFFRKEYNKALRDELRRNIRQSVTGNTLPEEYITKEVEREIREGLSFEDVYRDYRELLGLEDEVGVETADTEGGTNPLWLVRTSYAIGIIRNERRKVRRIIRQREDRERETKPPERTGKHYSRYG
jgi:hypothetical protein